VAEIKIERKQSRRRILPWILALVVLVLAIWGVAKAMDRRPVSNTRTGASPVDSLRDDTPPRLRQYAALPALRDAA
jgi:hypothetical protein